jgi:phosphate transport system ATP-binding protein
MVKPHCSTHICTDDVNLWFGDKHVLKDVNIPIYDKKITALIGPSGCGKSTLLRCFNRMNDLIPECRITGKVTLHSQDIYAPRTDVTDVRTRVGMVFQRPNPFPKSIYNNIAYGLHIRGEKKAVIDEVVEKRSKRSPQFIGFLAFWWPATAPLHRPGSGQ